MGLPSPADLAEKVHKEGLCSFWVCKMPKGLGGGREGGRLEKGEVKTTQKGRTGLHPPLGPQGTVLHCSGHSKQGKCVCTMGVTHLSVGAPAGEWDGRVWAGLPSLNVPAPRNAFSVLQAA